MKQIFSKLLNFQTNVRFHQYLDCAREQQKQHRKVRAKPKCSNNRKPAQDIADAITATKLLNFLIIPIPHKL